VDLGVEFEPDRCIACASCKVEEGCPMRAVSRKTGMVSIDGELCFHCGICVSLCPGNAFRCRMGSLKMRDAAGGCRSIPVVLRQSDRLRAEKLADELKKRIMGGSFEMTEPVGRII
ncbi:MAG TPA: 4Fe-4S binding protein, partial [Methanothrix sp.]|nr:4Fe-4S binding protein [Methanothrix sp.]